MIGLKIIACCFLGSFCFGLKTGFAGTFTNILDLSDYQIKDKMLRTNTTFRDSLEMVYSPRNPDLFLANKKMCLSVLRETGVDQATRSLSPWRYVKNYDSRRSSEDRYILDTACICEGCIVPSNDGNGYIYTESLMSVPIPFIRTVQVEDNGEYRPVSLTVHFGCHCVFRDSIDEFSHDDALLEEYY